MKSTQCLTGQIVRRKVSIYYTNVLDILHEFFISLRIIGQVSGVADSLGSTALV